MEEGKAERGGFKTGRWQPGSSGDKSLYPDLCDGLTRPGVPLRARSFHLIPYLISVHHTSGEIRGNKTFASSPCTVSSKQMRKIQGWQLQRHTICLSNNDLSVRGALSTPEFLPNQKQPLISLLTREEEVVHEVSCCSELLELKNINVLRI